jgi:hypothetical protein
MNGRWPVARSEPSTGQPHGLTADPSAHTSRVGSAGARSQGNADSPRKLSSPMRRFEVIGSVVRVPVLVRIR